MPPLSQIYFILLSRHLNSVIIANSLFVPLSYTHPHIYTHTQQTSVAFLSWYQAPYALTPVVIVVVQLPGSFDVWTHDSVQDPFQVLPGTTLCVFVHVNV